MQLMRFLTLHFIGCSNLGKYWKICNQSQFISISWTRISYISMFLLGLQVCFPWIFFSLLLVVGFLALFMKPMDFKVLDPMEQLFLNYLLQQESQHSILILTISSFGFVLLCPHFICGCVYQQDGLIHAWQDWIASQSCPCMGESSKLYRIEPQVLNFCHDVRLSELTDLLSPWFSRNPNARRIVFLEFLASDIPREHLNLGFRWRKNPWLYSRHFEVDQTIIVALGLQVRFVLFNEFFDLLECCLGRGWYAWATSLG